MSEPGQMTILETLEEIARDHGLLREPKWFPHPQWNPFYFVRSYSRGSDSTQLIRLWPDGHEELMCQHVSQDNHRDCINKAEEFRSGQE